MRWFCKEAQKSQADLGGDFRKRPSQIEVGTHQRNASSLVIHSWRAREAPHTSGGSVGCFPSIHTKVKNTLKETGILLSLEETVDIRFVLHLL